MAHENPWCDPDEIERLRVEWGDGLSMEAIGRLHNRSKNSICGKVHRLHQDNPLDFIPRPSPIKHDGDAAPKRPHAKRKQLAEPAPKTTLAPLQSINGPTVAAPTPRPKPPPSAPSPAPVKLEHRGECQWPLGNPGTSSFRLCEQPAVAGMPYCETHAELAYPFYRERRHRTLAPA